MDKGEDEHDLLIVSVLMILTAHVKPLNLHRHTEAHP